MRSYYVPGIALSAREPGVSKLCFWIKYVITSISQTVTNAINEKYNVLREDVIEELHLLGVGEPFLF